MFQAEMITIRSGFEASAPASAQRFPVFTQRQIVLCTGQVLAIHKQIKIHGQTLGVKTVRNAAALLRVQRRLFRGTVRFTKRQPVPINSSVRSTSLVSPSSWFTWFTVTFGQVMLSP